MAEDIDSVSGLDEAAGKLSSLLSNPAGKVTEESAEVPVTPKPVRTQQRNTVPNNPTGQESAPNEASADTDGDEAETPIEAPASWDAEAKAKFAKLPPDLQQVIAQRETDREKGVSTKLQEAATVRQKAEAEAAQTAQVRTAYEQRLHILARQIESSIPAEFQDIKTPADLLKLSDTNPQLAQKFVLWRDMASGVMSEIAQLEQAKTIEAQNRQQALLQREQAALKEKWPEMFDTVKGPTIKTEISALLRSYGFTDDDLAGIADHRILLFTKQAMQWRDAAKANEAAKAKVEKKPLPKVTKPGQGEGSNPSELSRSQLTRVARSGDQSATQAALERMLAS